ncbi:MAG TPA: hypothetical protein VFA55_05045 [Candidatus Kapabacteria bacterium]|nr:hypothetical protein [Candidatus Kapabacteria bacterium]
MSLKAFHIFFIGVSVVFALAFAGWSGTQYAANNIIGFLFASILSVLAGGGLVYYAYSFLRKLKKVPLL